MDGQRPSRWWGVAGAALVVVAAGSCANGTGDTGSEGNGSGDGGGGGGGDGTVSGEGTTEGGDNADVSPCGDTMTSALNCGSCGHVCAAGQMCSHGQCGLDCMAPEIQCGGDGGAPIFDGGNGAEPDGGDAMVSPSPADAGSGPYCATTSNDTNNCGECGKACGANHVCMAGACVLSCPPATTACPSANFCIPPGTCCTSADCADAGGGSCTGPGGTCGCASPDTLGTSCALATSAGSLAVGGSVTETGSLSAAGEENWLHVTFTGNTGLTYHPHIKLSTNPSSEYEFDLMNACGGAALACTEGGSCTGKTEWEVYYTATLTQMDVNSGSFAALPAVGNSGEVWIRVHRASGMPSCDAFGLTITN